MSGATALGQDRLGCAGHCSWSRGDRVWILLPVFRGSLWGSELELSDPVFYLRKFSLAPGCWLRSIK